METVINVANILAENIKESNEYINYKNLKDEILNNKDSASDLIKFQNLQAKLQRAQLLGEELNQEEFDLAKNLFDELSKDEKIKNFFDAEFEFSQMIKKVSEILSNVMEV